MKKIKFLVILIVLVSCKKTKLKGDLSFFVGTWEWKYRVKTVDLCNAFPYDSLITDSPTSAGFTYSLTFEEKGKLIVKKDGKVKKRYRLVYSRTEINGDQTNYYFKLDNKETVDLTVLDNWHYHLKTEYFPLDFKGKRVEGCEDTHSVFEKN